MSRNETFRKPAGNRKFELASCAEQPRNAWTVSRQEHDQWCRLIKEFKAQYPDANVCQTMLAEWAFKTHILLQRVEDRRVYVDGSETAATKVDKYYLELETEADRRYWAEWREYRSALFRDLREACKLLMATGIQLSIEGDLGTLFKLDEQTKRKLDNYKADEEKHTDNT